MREAGGKEQGRGQKRCSEAERYITHCTQKGRRMQEIDLGTKVAPLDAAADCGKSRRGGGGRGRLSLSPIEKRPLRRRATPIHPIPSPPSSLHHPLQQQRILADNKRKAFLLCFPTSSVHPLLRTGLAARRDGTKGLFAHSVPKTRGAVLSRRDEPSRDEKKVCCCFCLIWTACTFEFRECAHPPTQGTVRPRPPLHYSTL